MYMFITINQLCICIKTVVILSFLFFFDLLVVIINYLKILTPLKIKI